MREKWGKDERRKERARRSGGRVRERGKMWRRHGGEEEEGVQEDVERRRNDGCHDRCDRQEEEKVKR